MTGPRQGTIHKTADRVFMEEGKLVNPGYPFGILYSICKGQNCSLN